MARKDFMSHISDSAVRSAYNALNAEQKAQFFQGKEEQTRKIIGSLDYLLGSGSDYGRILMLYITVASRIVMGHENERIIQAVKTRFSDIVPESKALTVIECLRRITENYAFIDKADSPEKQAFNQYFDSQYGARFIENEKKLNDAEKIPDFGLNPRNPIYAHSSDGSYRYLNLLYTSTFEPLTWKRIGSIGNTSSSDPIDKYELYLPDGTVFTTVYINMYSRKSSAYCPKGLFGDGLKEVPKISSPQTILITEKQEEMSEEEEYLAFLQNYSKDSSAPKKESKGTSTSEKSSSKAESQNRNNTTAKSKPPESDEVLWESTTPILQGNLPVMVGKRTIYKKKTGEVYAVCSFAPITKNSIRAIQVDFRCYDVWHENVQPVERFQYNDLKTSRETYFGTNTVIPLPDPNTRTIDVIVQRIMFADGTLMQRSGNNVHLPPLELIDKYLNTKDLVNEYITLTYKNVKYTPVKAGAFWRCTCGAVNRKDEPSCHKCSDSADTLFKKLDKKFLQASIDEKSRLLREKAERERLERIKAEKKAEEERRARELKAAEEARQRAEKKGIRKKRITIVSAVFAAAAVIAYLIIFQFIPGEKYKAADELLNLGDRNAAYAAFVELGEFRDRHDSACVIKYEDAKKAFDAGDYEKAFELFSSIPEYSDSATQANEAVYIRATLLMEDGSYIEAAELFESITDHKDSKTQATTCRNEHSYIEATTLLRKGKYEEAGEIFETLESYRDSALYMQKAYYLHAKELIESGESHEAYLILSSKVNQGNNSYEDSIDLANTIEYEYATACLKEKRYADAAESFGNLQDYRDSASHCQEAKYLYGLELMSNDEYEEAEALFTELEDYKDSAYRLKESIYQQGVALIEAEKYDEAIAVLEQLSNHRDCARQVNEAKYRKARSLLSQNKYLEAQAVFEELGSYNDSAYQLKETKYQYAISMVKDKNYKKAVELFKELGSYSDSLTQWKATMYTYVLAHKNNGDKTTYEYLKELVKYNYQDSKSLYDELYEWRASLVYFNNDKNDLSSDMTSVSKTTPYLHAEFSLSGGPPGESVTLTHKLYWPNGAVTISDWYWENQRRATYFGIEWPDGLDYSKTGDLIIRIYVKSTGEEIGHARIKLI